MKEEYFLKKLSTICNKYISTKMFFLKLIHEYLISDGSKTLIDIIKKIKNSIFIPFIKLQPLNEKFSDFVSNKTTMTKSDFNNFLLNYDNKNPNSFNSYKMFVKTIIEENDMSELKKLQKELNDKFIICNEIFQLFDLYLKEGKLD